ncbi:MAG TPA: HAD family hydrolase [Thermomicrobiales bacterium]|nr:HAD family hydrolase [Thermomicrobiales bacterium]
MSEVELATTVFLDVDNTLLDNDRAKADLDRELGALLGERGRVRFWQTYEAVRRDAGMVDIPMTLARFEAGETSLARRAALADLFMRFPYADYLFPGALATIAQLRRSNRVAILSDGDPIFQPSKIWRAGLTAAVDGNAIVVDHKERRLPAVVATYPAGRYVLVDDKPGLLRAMAAALPAPTTTVFVRQGHYAADQAPAGWRPTVAIDAIDHLAAIDLDALEPSGAA